MDQNWFDRDEHKTERTCVCLCGNTFRSQARELPCFASRQVKEDGKPVLDKDGNPKYEQVTVTKLISKWACPKCHEGQLKSFH
jgi:hypothetical protein